MYHLETINAIKDELIRRNNNIAVAESVTAGHLQNALSQAENASQIFEGGITAYNLEQKVKHLGIDQEFGKLVDCVHPEIAKTMALGACRLFSSSFGIGVTGYATIVPQNSEKGLFAYFAIANNHKIIAAGELKPGTSEPHMVQVEYTNRILDIMKQQLGQLQEEQHAK